MTGEFGPGSEARRLRTINEVFFQNVENFNHDCLLSHYAQGSEVHFSTQRFKRAVFSLSFFLQRCGLAEGDRVAILSENRPEWQIADFAILLSRLIVVPIYPSLSTGQIKYCLSQTECSALVLSSREQLERFRSISSDLPHLQRVISMEDLEGEGEVLSLNQIFKDTPDPDWLIEARDYALSTDPESVATILHTSGTTGLPKGVMLTHSNIAFDLERSLRRLLFERVEQALSVLPLCHAFERLLCYGYLHQGIPIAYGDPYELPELLRRFRPGAMGCVPRVLEKIQEAVMGEIDGLPSWKQSIARFLLKEAARREQRIHDQRPRFFSALLHGITNLLLYRRLRRRVGGRLRHLICGGARLDLAVEGFFRDAGFSVIQGYGLTETSPVIALNPIKDAKLGTVGKPLDGVEVSFTEDGELLTRGPHVMKGYYNDRAGTRDVFRGDWLLTGDLCEQDADGYLTISGRKKEILVTSVGKNISPGPLEEKLQRSPFIKQAILVGEGRKFVSALIVPNQKKLVQYAQEQKISFQDLPDLLRCASIVDLIQGEIEAQQEGFSGYEKVRKFCFLEEKIFRDPEVITPTRKIRRSVLEEKYSRQIDELYQTR